MLSPRVDLSRLIGDWKPLAREVSTTASTGSSAPATTIEVAESGPDGPRRSPELDLLINALCGEPPAMTTHERGDWGEGLGRYGAWAAAYRPPLRGRVGQAAHSGQRADPSALRSR